MTKIIIAKNILFYLSFFKIMEKKESKSEIRLTHKSSLNV